MLAAALIAAVYVLLVARQVRLAAGPALPRRLARLERAATAALLAGSLDRAAYRAEVEILASLTDQKVKTRGGLY